MAFALRKENCLQDHIPFNVKGNGNIVLSVWKMWTAFVGLPYHAYGYASGVQPSERLASLGMMGDQLMALFKPSDNIML